MPEAKAKVTDEAVGRIRTEMRLGSWGRIGTEMMLGSWGRIGTDHEMSCIRTETSFIRTEMSRRASSACQGYHGPPMECRLQGYGDALGYPWQQMCSYQG